MSEVRRYTFDPDCSQEIPCECSMEEAKQGEYVNYSDYQTLELALATATALLDKRTGELDAAKKRLEKFRHYFSPQPDNDRFCKECSEYLTDDLHHRIAP